jgi:hypothetical protein
MEKKKRRLLTLLSQLPTAMNVVEIVDGLNSMQETLSSGGEATSKSVVWTAGFTAPPPMELFIVIEENIAP